MKNKRISLSSYSFLNVKRTVLLSCTMIATAFACPFVLCSQAGWHLGAEHPLLSAMVSLLFIAFIVPVELGKARYRTDSRERIGFDAGEGDWELKRELGACFAWGALSLIIISLYRKDLDYASIALTTLLICITITRLARYLFDRCDLENSVKTHPDDKKNIEIFSLVLEGVRSNSLSGIVPHAPRRGNLLKYLEEKKLFLFFRFQLLKNFQGGDTEVRLSKQLAKRDRAIFSAEEILKAAKKRKLHPVVFKGLAFERCIYGDIARRDAGDLDLLVRKEEVSTVHRLLLSLGYRQQIGPSSAGGARQSRALAAVRASQNVLDSAVRQAEPVRRHPYKGELSPYVRIDSPTIEVHDGFARLPEGFLEDVIKSSRKGFVVDPLHNFIFLLANAYENAESLFSNCFDYGVVLRDCVDIKEFWIKYGDTLDWNVTERLIDEVGLRGRAARVLGDLDEVYGREAVSDLLPDIERVHGYGGPNFLERAHDEKVARKIALPFFRKEVEEGALARLVGVDGTGESLEGRPPRPVMRFEVSPEKPGSFVLKIDARAILADDDQLLQVAFYYLEGTCDAVGYKLTLHRSDGQLQVTGNESHRLLNGAALLKDSGVCLPISFIEGNSSSHVRVELDDLPEVFAKSLKGKGIAVNASVFAHNHSNVYWQRDEPATVIMDEVAMGALWLIRNGWNNFLLSFGLFDFSIASNDHQLLEDLGMLFSISCMDAMPVASEKPSVCVTIQKDGSDLYSVAASDGKAAKLGLNRAQAVGAVLQLIMDSLVANGVESFSVLHAAAVLHDGKAVLLVGASGSGKSSLAYVLEESLPLLGDECIYVDMESGLAWGEEYPVNIKRRNSSIVPRIPIDDSVQAEWDGKTSLYCPIANGACGKFEISHVFTPHYDPAAARAALGVIECSELAPVIAGSLLGKSSPSELFACFVKMISRRKIKASSLVYSDVDEAARLVLHELDGDTVDVQIG